MKMRGGLYHVSGVLRTLKTSQIVIAVGIKTRNAIVPPIKKTSMVFIPVMWNLLRVGRRGEPRACHASEHCKGQATALRPRCSRRMA